MNEVHFVMQGKGGVGKSFVAVKLAQYLKRRDAGAVAIDTDPLTPTLARFLALEPMHIAVSDHTAVHLDKFDAMIETINGTQSDVVIDTGASTFQPLSQYFLENDVFSMLRTELGKSTTIHVVINAKTDIDLQSTLACFAAIAGRFPVDVGLNVWLNEYGGPIKTKDGYEFHELEIYRQHSARIGALIRIPPPTETELKDITAMQNARMTYDEVRGSPDFKLMAKSRLHRLERHVFDQLDLAALTWASPEAAS